MSILVILRDWINALTLNSLNSSLTFLEFMKKTAFFGVITLKRLFFHFFKFKWVLGFTRLPTTLPYNPWSFSFPIFQEVIYSNLWLTTLKQIALTQVFSFCSLSAINIYLFKRLHIEGIEPVLPILLGLLLADFFLHFSFYFGYTNLFITWSSWNKFFFYGGIILSFIAGCSFLYESYVKRHHGQFYQEGLDSFDRQSKIKPSQSLFAHMKDFKDFIKNSYKDLIKGFLLFWFNSPSVLNLLRNLTATPTISFLESFELPNASIESILFYIACRCFLFYITFYYAFPKVRRFINRQEVEHTFVGKTTGTLLFLLGSACVPFYTFEYILSGVFGIVPKDFALRDTILDPYVLSDTPNVYDLFYDAKLVPFKASKFDRGRYLYYPNIENIPPSFENIQFKPLNLSWLSQIRLNNIALRYFNYKEEQKKEKAELLQQIIKNVTKVFIKKENIPDEAAEKILHRETAFAELVANTYTGTKKGLAAFFSIPHAKNLLHLTKTFTEDELLSEQNSEELTESCVELYVPDPEMSRDEKDENDFYDQCTYRFLRSEEPISPVVKDYFDIVDTVTSYNEPATEDETRTIDAIIAEASLYNLFSPIDIYFDKLMQKLKSYKKIKRSLLKRSKEQQINYATTKKNVPTHTSINTIYDDFEPGLSYEKKSSNFSAILSYLDNDLYKPNNSNILFEDQSEAISIPSMERSKTTSDVGANNDDKYSKGKIIYGPGYMQITREVEESPSAEPIIRNKDSYHIEPVKVITKAKVVEKELTKNADSQYGLGSDELTLLKGVIDSEIIIGQIVSSIFVDLSYLKFELEDYYREILYQYSKYFNIFEISKLFFKGHSFTLTTKQTLDLHYKQLYQTTSLLALRDYSIDAPFLSITESFRKFSKWIRKNRLQKQIKNNYLVSSPYTKKFKSYIKRISNQNTKILDYLLTNTTRSFASKVHNQQFKGTLLDLAPWFSLSPYMSTAFKYNKSQNIYSVDTELNECSSIFDLNSTVKKYYPVIKYDQPLYKDKLNEKGISLDLTLITELFNELSENLLKLQANKKPIEASTNSKIVLNLLSNAILKDNFKNNLFDYFTRKKNIWVKVQYLEQEPLNIVDVTKPYRTEDYSSDILLKATQYLVDEEKIENEVKYEQTNLDLEHQTTRESKDLSFKLAAADQSSKYPDLPFYRMPLSRSFTKYEYSGDYRTLDRKSWVLPHPIDSSANIEETSQIFIDYLTLSSYSLTELDTLLTPFIEPMIFAPLTVGTSESNLEDSEDSEDSEELEELEDQEEPEDSFVLSTSFLDLTDNEFDTEFSSVNNWPVDKSYYNTFGYEEGPNDTVILSLTKQKPYAVMLLQAPHEKHTSFYKHNFIKMDLLDLIGEVPASIEQIEEFKDLVELYPENNELAKDALRVKMLLEEMDDQNENLRNRRQREHLYAIADDMIPTAFKYHRIPAFLHLNNEKSGYTSLFNKSPITGGFLWAGSYYNPLLLSNVLPKKVTQTAAFLAKHVLNWKKRDLSESDFDSNPKKRIFL